MYGTTKQLEVGVLYGVYVTLQKSETAICIPGVTAALMYQSAASANHTTLASYYLHESTLCCSRQ